jgi:hypothetical protein
MIGCRRATPVFIYTLAFALQLRKSTENLIQVIFGRDGRKRHRYRLELEAAGAAIDRKREGSDAAAKCY